MSRSAAKDTPHPPTATTAAYATVAPPSAPALPTKPLRAAIIGTGRVASLLEKDPLRGKPHTHAGYYHADPRVALVTGADIDPDRLAEFGQDWSIPPEHLYADYRDMLAAERPDLVSICAYAPDRAQMTADALSAGARGLWLEKAIACSLREAQHMRERIERAGAVAVVDHRRRLHPAYRAVRDLIADARYGALRSIHVNMCGQLIHTGTHAYDVLRYWCGEAAEVRGWVDGPPPRRKRVSDAQGHAHFLFQNGTHAFISASLRRYYIFQFDLIFEDARIHLGNDIQTVLRPAPSRLYSGYKELAPDPDTPLDSPCQLNLLTDLLEALHTRREPVNSVQNAVEALRLGLAIFQSSARSSKPVSPADVDPAWRVDSL